MVFILFLIFSNLPSEDLEPLTRILEKHARSLGSVEAWRGIQAATYDLDIHEPEFRVRGVYRATRTGKMRIDIYADGQHVFTEAFNGREGWQWRAGESRAKKIDGTAAAALWHGIEMPGHLYTLLDMIPRGNSLTYLGDEERLDGKSHLLKLTLQDGHEKFYFLSVETGAILASSDHRAFHPDLDKTRIWIESRPADFRKIGGIVKPFKSVNWDRTKNKWLGTTTVLSLRFGEQIEDAYFETTHIKPLAYSE